MLLADAYFLELKESFSSSDGFVELEMDSLNQHESMASLTSLISHMNHNVKVDKDSKVGVSLCPFCML